METLVLMISFFAFIILPPSWLYAMFKYPEEFGPVGPRACELPGYAPSPGDELVKNHLLTGLWLAKNAYPFFEWCIHCEWMSKNHPFVSK